MVDLSGLFEVVQIFTDIFPIIIIIGLIGLVIGLILELIPSNGKLTKKLKGMFIVSFAFLFLFSMAAPVGAAEGLTIDTNVVFEGTIVTVECTGLTVDTEYTIWATGNDFTLTNITFTAKRAVEFQPFSTGEDADGAFTLNIAASSSGVAASAVGTLYVSMREAGDFLPVDFFLQIIAPIIVIGVIFGLGLMFVRSMGLRKGAL